MFTKILIANRGVRAQRGLAKLRGTRGVQQAMSRGGHHV
ncbi:MAG: hypothetical protein OJF60_003564 [Burkholderiaceae bacterium]|jgi:hypothetical protein|nr:MAG: hypothetical protein OJF60_003564 [Burkholderiaceae bacterium]